MDNVPNLQSLTLITGASSGIGEEFSRIFAKKKAPMALVGRNEQALRDLGVELTHYGAPPPLILPFDLSLPGSPKRIVEIIDSHPLRVGTLINNAGYGLAGPCADSSVAGQLGIVDVNIRALLELTLLLLPQIKMIRGSILNVASVAAFTPGPDLAVYFASKAFVLSFSEALYQELKSAGVGVTALCPGPTPTGFQKRAGFEVGNRFPAKVTTLSATRVAEIGYQAMIDKKRVVIPGFANKLSVAFGRIMPHSLVLPLVQKILNVRKSPSALKNG